MLKLTELTLWVTESPADSVKSIALLKHPINSRISAIATTESKILFIFSSNFLLFPKAAMNVALFRQPREFFYELKNFGIQLIHILKYLFIILYGHNYPFLKNYRPRLRGEEKC